MSNDTDYSAESITVLEGMEAVRKRPGMYIGNTDDGTGLHHWVYEVLGNAIDEADAGYGGRITLTIHGDREITIEDRGRGIPVDLHPKLGRPCVEVIFTTLHAGGMFDPNAYKIGSGLHGVGVSVVNALSEHLTVDVFRDGAHWRQRFERGTSCGPLERVEDAVSTGTRVRMSADPEIFLDPVLNFLTLHDRLEELAWMHPSVTFELFDHRTDDHATFHTPGGMVEALVGWTTDEDVLYVCEERDGVYVEFAIRRTGWLSKTLTYVNGRETPEHGTHLRGLARAFHRALLEDTSRSWAELFLDRDLGGFLYLHRAFDVMIHVRMPDPHFAYSKRKLVSNEVLKLVYEVARPVFDAWIEEHPEQVDALFTMYLPEDSPLRPR